MPSSKAQAVVEAFDTNVVVRLTGLEVLEAGELRGRRDDAEQLSAIREGALSFDELLSTASALQQSMQREAKASQLPTDVDYERYIAEANQIVLRLAREAGTPDDPVTEVVKVKSMATQEIGLNEALEAEGIRAYETDLAELIVQLGKDRPSHLLVPATHRNRGEIRDIFRTEMKTPALLPRRHNP